MERKLSGDPRPIARTKAGFVEAHGEVSSHQKSEAVRLLNEDPKVRVFLGHPGSGGIGLNLTVAPYSIFYSRNYSLEQYLQAQARNYRGGQQQKVTHYQLITENTIDEFVLEKLSYKEAISEKLLGDIAKELANEK